MSNQNSKNSASTFVENRSRSRRFLLSAFLLIMALGVFFLPVIVVKSPLRNVILDYSTRDINGEIEVGSVSAGWLSPIVISNLQLYSNDRQEVVSIQTVRTSQSLLSFLLGGDVGTVAIEQPTLDLSLRTDGSNLEDVLVQYLQADEANASSSLPKMECQIVDGTIRVQSDLLSGSSLFQDINANIRTAQAEGPLAGEIQFQCSTQSEHAGRVSAKFLIDRGSRALASNHIEANLQSDQLPLEALAPVLTRILGPANCSGILNADVEIDLDLATGKFETQLETFHARRVALVAPDYLGRDQLVAQKLNATGRLELNSRSAIADQFKADSEFAKIHADGKFDFEQLTKLGSTAEIPREPFRLDGEVDLAQCLTMLPETMHIRENVQIEGGLFKWTMGTRVEGRSNRMVVNAETTNFRFKHNGESFTWNQPLRAVAVAANKNGQLVLEDLQLKSEFLSLAGNASIEHGKVGIEGDLAKLLNQVGQLVDIGEFQLAGSTQGELVWDMVSAAKGDTAEFPIELNGNFSLVEPMVSIAPGNTWREPQVQLTLKSTCVFNRMTNNLAVNKSALNIQAGDQSFNAELAIPIASLSSDWKYQFNCVANGPIEKYLKQARSVAEFPEFACTGELESKFMLTVNPQSFRLNQIQFQAANFGFDGFTLQIREPRISGRANLKYQFDDGDLYFTQSKLNCSTVALNTKQLRFKLKEKILADGAVVFRGNANRMSQWIGFSMPGDSVRWDGIANGTVTFSSQTDRLGGQLAAKVKELVFVQPAAAQPARPGVQTVSQQQAFVEFWREANARLTTKFWLSDDFNGLQIKNASLESHLANVQLSGRINELASTMRANLHGRWMADWKAVNQMLRDSFGNAVVLTGETWQPLKIKGPLYDSTGNYAWIPRQLTGETSVQIKHVSLLGVPMGAPQFDLRLDQSLATFASAKKKSIIDQLLASQPIVDLRQNEPVVYLQKGQLLDRWNVTVEDSRTWLKFAAPLIADATSAEGQVSATLDGAAIPVFDPNQASAQGELHLQNLTIGPGPLAQQLIPLVDQVRSILKPAASPKASRSTWIQLEPHRLPFMIRDGHVIHEGFEMKFKDFIVRTSGSVGFDQSLQLVAEIPILSDWVEGDRVLSSLAGKSISIPISGTLSKPQMDRRGVLQTTQRMLAETARGVVNEKINQEVGQFQEKVGGRIRNELNQIQNTVNDKIKTQFEDKVQNELRNGFKKLFGDDKK